MSRTIAALLVLGLVASCLMVPSQAFASKTAPPKPLLVLAGASGKTGKEVLLLAAKSRWRVRALTSDLPRAKTELGKLYEYGEWLQVDLSDKEAVRKAVSGADHVVSAIGAHSFKNRDIPEHIDFQANVNLIDAARDAKVQHFVLISSSTAGVHRDQTQAAVLMNVRFWKTRAEEHLRASGMTYTVIGPGGLTLEPARRQGLKIVPRESYVSTDVSRADVARVAIDALRNPQSANKSFALINDKNVAIDTWREQLTAHAPDRPAGGAATAIAMLAWMSGHWTETRVDGTVIDEVWLSPAGELMLGMNRLIPAGKIGAYEQMRIETRPNGVWFVAAPQAQPGGEFVLTGASSTRVSFFNLSHDFPQGIVYWRDGDELLARVDGLSEGKLRSLNFRFKRFVPARRTSP